MRIAAPAAALLVTAVLLVDLGARRPDVHEPARTAPAASLLRNGLAATPPMGWNDWNAFGCAVSDQLVRTTADAMVSTGMRAAGYRYVNLDGCWLASTRAADGSLQADPVKFPNGIKPVADYVHARGLRFGIYEDAGTQTCGGAPGSFGHYAQDAGTFASWGVDYLKLDWCHTAGLDPKEQYRAMRDALAATGRPIVFSMCEWGLGEPWRWAAPLANLWRTTDDISDSWSSVMAILDRQVGLSRFAHAGAWNDPDMLEVGNGGMTVTEYRAHFSLWAILAAPLLAGTDVRRLSPAAAATLLNGDVIAVDQDAAGIEGSKVGDAGATEVWARPLAGGARAVVLLNRGPAAAVVATTAAEVGLPASSAYARRDLWTKQVTRTGGTIAATVPSHGAVMLRVSVTGNGAAMASAP